MDRSNRFNRLSRDFMRHPIQILFLLLLSLSLVGCASSGSQTSSANTKRWIGHTETGQASYYNQKYHGRKTASGERMDQGAKTAAHRTLPFGSRVKVTHAKTGKSVVVRINDRGPFVRGRVIDLSKSAFKAIGDLEAGLIPVKIQVIE